ncbi:MAG: hypothetical protein ACXU88_15815 [Myxococcaceae bacterium]
MSRRPVLPSHRPLLVLAAAVACATTGKTGYYQSRATDHVYVGTKEELVAKVTGVMTERGLVVARPDPDTLQTPWKVINLPQKTGSYTEATERGYDVLVYESLRVTVISIDARHQVLRVERGSASALLGKQNTLKAGGVLYNRLREAYDRPAPAGPTTPGAAAVALPRGTTDPEFTREPELGWVLLQSVDPDGAHAIEHEQTVVSGCTHVHAPRPPTPEVLRVAKDCPDVPGVDDLLAARRLIVLGEVHGTQQAPEFVGALACRSASQGFPLAIGFELPQQDNPVLERYLASEGTPEDRQRYLGTDAWRRDWHDGRSSVAMLALIDQVRALRKAGAEVGLFGVDDRSRTGDVRDAAMAEFIDVERRRMLDRAMIVLVGNLHAQTTPGKVTAGYLPLGARLETYGLRPVSLLMAYDSGTAWLCTLQEHLGCGVQQVRQWPPRSKSAVLTAGDLATTAGGLGSVGSAVPDTPLPPRFVRLWDKRSEGFDGLFYVGPLAASPPAIESTARGSPSPQ